MKTQIEFWTAWILGKIQLVAANFDVEVLQWPGGGLVAPFLWLYVTGRSFWPLDLRRVGMPGVHRCASFARLAL